MSDTVERRDFIVVYYGSPQAALRDMGGKRSRAVFGQLDHLPKKGKHDPADVVSVDDYTDPYDGSTLVVRQYLLRRLSDKDLAAHVKSGSVPTVIVGEYSARTGLRINASKSRPGQWYVAYPL